MKNLLESAFFPFMMLLVVLPLPVHYFAGEAAMLTTAIVGFSLLLASFVLWAILSHFDNVKALRDDIGAWTELYDYMKSSHRKACADLKKANNRARDFEIQVNDADYKIADFNDLIDSNAKKHDAEIAELLAEIAKLKQIIKDNDDAFVLKNDIAAMEEKQAEDKKYIDSLEKFNAGMMNMLISGISEMEESGFGGSWEVGRAMGNAAVEYGIHRAGEITQMFDLAPVWSEAICDGFSSGVEYHLNCLTASGKAKIRLG